MREGLAAADLLASDALKSTIKSLMVEGFATVTESRPDEAALREETYNLMRALQAIEIELTNRVQAMEELQRSLDEAAATDADPLLSDSDFGRPE